MKLYSFPPPIYYCRRNICHAFVPLMLALLILYVLTHPNIFAFGSSRDEFEGDEDNFDDK